MTALIGSFGTPARTAAQPASVMALTNQRAVPRPAAKGAAAQPHARRFTTARGRMRFVRIPGGVYTLGARPGLPHHSAKSMQRLQVRRRVAVKTFWIAATDTTVWQFGRFVEQSHYRPRHVDGFLHRWVARPITRLDWKKPVTFINQVDAGAFCRWLGAGSKFRYRLPTADQWEIACHLGAAPRTKGVQWRADTAWKAAIYRDNWLRKNSGGASAPSCTEASRPHRPVRHAWRRGRANAYSSTPLVCHAGPQKFSCRADSDAARASGLCCRR